MILDCSGIIPLHCSALVWAEYFGRYFGWIKPFSIQHRFGLDYGVIMGYSIVKIEWIKALTPQGEQAWGGRRDDEKHLEVGHRRENCASNLHLWRTGEILFSAIFLTALASKSTASASKLTASLSN